MFRTTGRGTSVVRKSKPGGRASEKQAAVRAATRTIMTTWPTLTVEEHATWTQPALDGETSRINAFQKTNFKRLAVGLPLARTWPPEVPPPNSLQVYRGGVLTPDLTKWSAGFLDDGRLTQIGSSVWASPDLQSLAIEGDPNLDGVFVFQNFPALCGIVINDCEMPCPPIFASVPLLTDITLQNDGMGTCPIVNAVASLVSFAFNNNPIGDAPDLSGLVNLTCPEFTGCDLSQVDSIFNDLAGLATLATEGEVLVAGGTNAPPTRASAAARAFLTTPPNDWYIETNPRLPPAFTGASMSRAGRTVTASWSIENAPDNLEVGLVWDRFDPGPDHGEQGVADESYPDPVGSGEPFTVGNHANWYYYLILVDTDLDQIVAYSETFRLP